MHLPLQPLKDWILLLMVAVLLAVDLLFLIIVTPWRLRLTERLVSRDVCDLYYNMIYVCSYIIIMHCISYHIIHVYTILCI